MSRSPSIKGNPKHHALSPNYPMCMAFPPQFNFDVTDANGVTTYYVGSLYEYTT